MSTADQYLQQILAKYTVDASQGTGRHQTALHIANKLKNEWAGQHLRSIGFSGSIAKGTANSCANDIDLFIALEPTTPGSLSDIYSSLWQTASGWWPGQTRQQNVSIGVQVNGFHIDLVPGRLQQGYQIWYSLYRNKANTWCQTSIDQHIQLVAKSGRANEIRLVKLWRTLHRMEFPSFMLELAVIEALRGCWSGQLAINFSTALQWIAQNIRTVRLVDPANSNNIVSDDMTATEKKNLAVAATNALQQQTYSQLVW